VASFDVPMFLANELKGLYKISSIQYKSLKALETLSRNEDKCGHTWKII
jgi:hypothetical protein